MNNPPCQLAGVARRRPAKGARFGGLPSPGERGFRPDAPVRPRVRGVEADMSKIACNMYITMRKTVSLHLRQRVPHPAPPWLIQYGARLILPSFPA